MVQVKSTPRVGLKIRHEAEAGGERRVWALSLLKAYCKRNGLPLRKLAKWCEPEREHKSVLKSFAALKAPTRDTVATFAKALGFSETVISALFGELTWFAGDSHSLLPLRYLGDKPTRVTPYLYHFNPDNNGLPDLRAEAEFDLEQAIARGELGHEERERIEEHEWWMRVRKPNAQQISDMVCASYLADAGIIEAPGPLSPGYNAIDAAFQPFGFRLTPGDALDSENPPGSQSKSRAIAMAALGFLARTLTLSSKESWPIYKMIADRFPLGVKYEGTQPREKMVQDMLASGIADSSHETSRFLDCDIIQLPHRTTDDGFKRFRFGRNEYDFPEGATEICRAFEDIIDDFEAAIAKVLEFGPECRPGPHQPWEAFFANYEAHEAAYRANGKYQANQAKAQTESG